jgi:glycerol dehydrogenase
MNSRAPYFPKRIFAENSTESREPPRVLISPHRYIQGKDTLDHLGRYISILPSRRPAVLITEGGKRRFGRRIEESLSGSGADPELVLFRGECCIEEVERIVDYVHRTNRTPDAVIAVGGGKCIDAGKCVAFRIELPLVVCPTIASTDAPCSAVSVMYSQDGVGKGPEFFPNSPALVVVDTRIIAEAPLRHFIAGMGDALATYYEARTCFRNRSGRNMLGGRSTLAAMSLAELCAKTIYEDARRAIENLKSAEIDETVENIVEANTLLSGVGFESGGLAAAHAIAAGLTVVPVLHRDYLHGELVGIGLVAQMILEKDPGEAERVARFLAKVGLPVSLQQLQLDAGRDEGAIMEAMTAAMKEPFVRYEPLDVSAHKLFAAFCEAGRLGSEIHAECGDAPFRSLHSQ